MRRLVDELGDRQRRDLVERHRARSGASRRCSGATLPVRFWKRHGGSARTVRNRRPAANAEQVLGGADAHVASCRPLPAARSGDLRAPGPASPSARSRRRTPSVRDIDPLDQQLHDPRLLGREQLVPQRVELQRAPRAPRPR